MNMKTIAPLALLVLASITGCGTDVERDDETSATDTASVNEGLEEATPNADNAAASNCSAQAVLYADANFNTPIVRPQGPRGQWLNLTASVSDRTSSIRTSACGITVATNANGGGDRYYFPPQSGYRLMPTGFNDNVSSVFVH